MNTDTPAVYYTLDEVLARAKCSKTKLYDEIKRGAYPAPVKRGRSSLWIAHELDAAIAREAAELKRQRDQAQAA